GLRFAASDAGNDRPQTTTRRAYDLLSQGFGPGFNGPLQLAVHLPAAGAAPGLARLTATVSRSPGVASVSPPRLNASGDTAAMNVLSIGAALGVTQAVFERGWGAGLLGVTRSPIEAFIPVIAFAIVFGLSMDYEVFLVSRIHEEWTHNGDHTRAVREGLIRTGRV